MPAPAHRSGMQVAGLPLPSGGHVRLVTTVDEVVLDRRDLGRHRARAIEQHVHVDGLQLGREVEVLVGRRLRLLVRLDEHEVAVGLRVVGGLVGSVPAATSIRSLDAVAVGVAVGRAGLAGVAHAVAVRVLAGVGDAVVVAVAIEEVVVMVHVGVGRRRCRALRSDRGCSRRRCRGR